MERSTLATAVLVLIAITAACGPAEPSSSSLSPPEAAGEFAGTVPDRFWEKCQERVRGDLKYDPQRAEFALKFDQLRAVETGEFATEYYGPLLWRFDAELLGSNAFGTLVRKDLRCYVAFDKSTQEKGAGPEPTVLFEILEPGEVPVTWEKE